MNQESYDYDLEEENEKIEVTLDGRVRDLFYAHGESMKIHANAMACHCECLGMNAENAMAVCSNYAPPYNEAAYFSVMQKWGLIDENKKSLI